MRFLKMFVEGFAEAGKAEMGFKVTTPKTVKRLSVRQSEFRPYSLSIVFLIIAFALCAKICFGAPLTDAEVNNMSPELKEFVQDICETHFQYAYNKTRADQERKVIGEHDGQVIYQFSSDYPNFVKAMTTLGEKQTKLEAQWKDAMKGRPGKGMFNYDKCPMRWR